MATITEILGLIPTLRAQLGDEACASDAREALARMPDSDVLAVLVEASDLVKAADQIRLLAAGIAAARSSRAAGHSGIAQTRGHRTPIALVQEVAGIGRGEAARVVRVGEALVSGIETSESAAVDTRADVPPVASDTDTERDVTPPWHVALDDALLRGALTGAAHDAIRRGLGTPPDCAINGSDASFNGDSAANPHEVWAIAAEQLVEEAASRTIEELRAAARAVRDQIDPEGAARRFHERFERRSFRTWTDEDGVHRGTFVFDDEAFLWVRTVIDSALRPRRGGPRFVDPVEAARAQELSEDPRTNDQLTYDLMMDVLRAGALADAESVFGTRQAGVRLVQVVSESGERAPVAYSEDGIATVPAAVAEQRICTSGVVPVSVDATGNPLDVGREHRLFTPRQRVALALRDGGCRWPNCDRPASYGEAHHIDPYAMGGRTDIDRGILLCRFHHMNLHHRGWHITRQGAEDFMLHDPDGGRIALRPRLALGYAWAGVDPPPRRFRERAS